MPLRESSSQQSKKKPPPRPPPPNLNKLKSKSTHNIQKRFESLNLMDWSPPSSPSSESMPKFGGSVSSSFSSSTSSLASIKKNTDYFGLYAQSFSSTEWGPSTSPKLNKPGSGNQPSTNSNDAQTSHSRSNGSNNMSTPTAALFRPTIIRPSNNKKRRPEIPDASQSNPSLPMPTMPPPSPPKNITDVITPYGIALFQFPATQPGDLALEVDDVVILIRRVNKEWLYGQVDNREGIFPENFIQIIVPLPEDLGKKN